MVSVYFALRKMGFCQSESLSLFSDWRTFGEYEMELSTEYVMS